MRYEVEQKFPVQDLRAVRAQLAALEVSCGEPFEEVDSYYAHPSRDFSRTDEALRIRRCAGRNRLTYKGPKIDATTKTRHEIDLALPDDEPTLSAWHGLLEALGFRRVAEVRKTRCKAIVPWQGHRVELSLDQVMGLGEFVELELITDAQGIASARGCVASLASRLGLSGSERRSYLELLLERGLAAQRVAGPEAPEGTSQDQGA